MCRQVLPAPSTYRSGMASLGLPRKRVLGSANIWPGTLRQRTYLPPRPAICGWIRQVVAPSGSCGAITRYAE